VQGQLTARGVAVEEAFNLMARTHATIDCCENITALVSSACLRQLAPARTTVPGSCPDRLFSPEGDTQLQAPPQPQPVASVTQQYQGNGETTRTSMKQGHSQAQEMSEFRIGAIKFTAKAGGRGSNTQPYQHDGGYAGGGGALPSQEDVLPSKRCAQPPTIIFTLLQDYRGLLSPIRRC
jgi:hypothetical protein